MPVFREHQQLEGLAEEEIADLKEFALANQTDRQGSYRPVLALRNGRLHTRNYVGVIETRRGTVVEILPKVDFFDCDDRDERTRDERTREVFLRMLRTWRGLRDAQLNETGIRELRDFHMLDVFVRIFLANLVRLTQRGLARHYHGVEDNLPRLRGRIRFPQHIRRNAANRARFFVAFDEFTADRPVNRLIHSALHKLRQIVTHPDNQQLLHQLRICFSEIPRSERPEVDWERHRIDRSMRHYEAVMAWVGLFLFNHGLATFSGKHVNQALLFPMEEVFEDYVADGFRRHQRGYRVRTQGPRRAFTRIGEEPAFRMKPDIALIRSGEVRFVLDAKWKAIDGGDKDPKHGISQGDVYQLYSYGRKFGCATVALIYPKTRKFASPLRYEFQDRVAGQPLPLLCVPFDVTRPKDSVAEIMRILADRARSELGRRDPATVQGGGGLGPAG